MRFVDIILPLALASSAAALLPRGGCKMQRVYPAHAGSMCGQQGYYQQPSSCGTSHESCMENCRAKCWGNSVCMSYSYDSSSKKCTQYRKKASSQGYKSKKGSSMVWDKCCWENHCPTCPMRKTLCGVQCKDLKTDNDNCGACSTVCPDDSSCENGACQCDMSNETICDGVCTDTQTDFSNCGSCGARCAGGGTKGSCVGGECTCPFGTYDPVEGCPPE